MAQAEPEVERKEKRKKRKSTEPEADESQSEVLQEQSPKKGKGSRRQAVDNSILEKYHLSQELQGIIKKRQRSEEEGDEPFDQAEEYETKPLVPEEPAFPTVKLTTEQQQEVEQVLVDVNKLRKEKKKKLQKEKKKFKSEQSKLAKEQAAEEAKESKKEKALAYLKQWKKHRDEWKFKKIFHIWLLKNWQNSGKVPDKRFRTFLKYLKSQQKSGALTRLEVEAKAIVDKNEAATTTTEGSEEETNQSYERARSILQWIV